MSGTIERDSYRYIPGPFQYSAGVAALPGFAIERVRFANPIPLAEGFRRIETFLAEQEQPLTAFCACELRSPGQFTDAGFIAVGAPRRAGLASLADEADLGLCRSGRKGLTDDPSFCGRFRTPTLRNVALRPSFFHNGSVRSLRDAVAFYATRDTDPGRWYSRRADGSVRLYDDLPAQMAPFVNREPPFQPLPDGRPRLDDAEIDDIVAFLRTLSDADVAR